MNKMMNQMVVGACRKRSVTEGIEMREDLVIVAHQV
jgi:hypothetical protein